MKDRRKATTAQGRLVLVLAALTMTPGCSGPTLGGRAVQNLVSGYALGVPNFSMEAVSTWRGGRPGVDVYVSIPRGSLVFVDTDSGYAAVYSGHIRLLDARGRERLAEASFADTVYVADFEATQAYTPAVRHERLSAGPGDYVVEVQLTDEHSDQDARQRQELSAAAIEAGRPALSSVWLEGRTTGDSLVHLVSLHVPAAVESLQAVVELAGSPGAGPFAVNMRLLRLPSDTTVALPPYWPSPLSGSLIYRGVHVGEWDTVATIRRPPPASGEPVRLRYPLPDLSEGVYRVEVEADVPPTGARAAESVPQGRLFTVMSGAFPAVTNLGQMVEALAYIAYDDELDAIRDATTADELKRRFDTFWGSLVDDRQVAANLIELYYSRVEEANLLFTAYKEGWKTDRGMVYIIMGPPGYVEDHLDSEIWHYRYGQEDPADLFVFERVRTVGQRKPFENYVLERQPYYQRSWLRTVERWRTGAVL